MRNPFVVANRTWAVAAPLPVASRHQVQTVLLPVTHVRQVGVESVPVVQDPHTIGTRSRVNSANFQIKQQQIKRG
jgi:hypothetical protein